MRAAAATARGVARHVRNATVVSAKSHVHKVRNGMSNKPPDRAAIRNARNVAKKALTSSAVRARQSRNNNQSPTSRPMPIAHAMALPLKKARPPLQP